VKHAPSPLIPGLLDRLEELVGTNATLRAGVAAWRTLWNARLKLYDIADAVRQTGKLHVLDYLGNPIHELDLPLAFGSPDWNGALPQVPW